ncbi:hypothetical protein DFH06DRAFT_1153024 [Mycena polygramma]|nr:hypothetical protein DFH06DRAFT_1153024 [Mycena polygramma]
MASLNLGPASHLELRVHLPGGIDQDASSSQSKGKHKEIIGLALNTEHVASTSRNNGKQKEMSSDIDLSSDNVFDPGQWIGTGKLFADVPFYVSNACRTVREIPSTFASKLPSPHMTVSEFLTVRLPQIWGDSTKFSRRTSDWFSTDAPNCEADVVLSTVIPPLSFVRDLEQGISQAWLNGTKSLVHPTDKNIRLPLWSVTFFRKIIDLEDGHQKWAQSLGWLPQDEHYLLDQVEWNSTHPGAPDGQSDWTRLIDDEWLSGGNIDGMMHHLQTRLSEHPVLESSTIVALLRFQNSITKFATQGIREKFMRRYVDAIKGGKSKVYFPMHVNNNHWIVFTIDFANKTFGYGDSMARRGSKPKNYLFITHLETWLEAEFTGSFKNLGDCLTHSAQRDYIHCGIYTLNTLRHALFGDRILGLEDCRRVRLEWFKKFMHRAGLGAASGSADQWHENSDFSFESKATAPLFPKSPLVAMSLQSILNPAPSAPASIILTAEPIPAAAPTLAESATAMDFAAEATIKRDVNSVPSGSKTKDAAVKSRDQIFHQTNWAKRPL